MKFKRGAIIVTPVEFEILKRQPQFVPYKKKPAPKPLPRPTRPIYRAADEPRIGRKKNPFRFNLTVAPEEEVDKSLEDEARSES